MDGGGDQHALTHLGGGVEDGAGGGLTALLVQQHVLAAAGVDREGLVAQHLGDLVGVHARAVDEVAGLHGAAVGGGKDVALGGLLNGDHLKVQLKLRAVVHGVADGGDGQAVGAHDGTRGSIESAGQVGVEVGLHGEKLLLLHDAQTLHAVCHAAAVDILYLGALVLKGHHQRAVALVTDTQLGADLLHHLGAADVHAGLHGACLGVKARVDDGGVGGGGTACHVVLLVHNANSQIIRGQSAGDHTAHNTRADHGNVKHSVIPLYCFLAQKKMHLGAGKEPGPLHLQISALFRMKTLYHIRLFLSSSHFAQKITKILLTSRPACAIMTVL